MKKVILMSPILIFLYACSDVEPHTRAECTSMLSKMAEIYKEDPAESVTDEMIKTCMTNENFSRMSTECVDKASTHKDLARCGLEAM